MNHKLIIYQMQTKQIYGLEWKWGKNKLISFD